VTAREPSAVEEDFREWVVPHLVVMGRLADRLGGSAERDDIVQEALVRAWRRRSTYDASRGSARSWLLAIVADRARRHRGRLSPTAQLIDLPAEPASAATSIEASLDLDAAMGRLPRRQRLAVELHYMLGLGVKECATVMGCSDGTVKSTLFDARKRLRRDLGSGGTP
jgi:RNA polymerase sigma-70 factor (ECF subfamily)